MKSSPFWKDSLFVGIVLLQPGVVALIGADARGDSLSANQLSNAVSGASIAPGSVLPAFTTYAESGQRLEPLIRGRRATIIFKNDCTCDQDEVNRLIEVARRQQEDVTIVVPASWRKLPQIRKENQLKGRLLAMRNNQFAMLVGQSRMPLPIRLAPDGSVLSSQ